MHVFQLAFSRCHNLYLVVSIYAWLLICIQFVIQTAISILLPCYNCPYAIPIIYFQKSFYRVMYFADCVRFFMHQLAFNSVVHGIFPHNIDLNFFASSCNKDIDVIRFGNYLKNYEYSQRIRHRFPRLRDPNNYIHDKHNLTI